MGTCAASLPKDSTNRFSVILAICEHSGVLTSSNYFQFSSIQICEQDASSDVRGRSGLWSLRWGHDTLPGTSDARSTSQRLPVLPLRGNKWREDALSRH
eukprot:scaffold43858_cov30-Phaeocystis_antarctica.AAC.3